MKNICVVKIVLRKETQKRKELLLSQKEKNCYLENICVVAKKKRIAAGSGEKMRKPGAKGAPQKGIFKKIAAKQKKKGKT